MKTLLPLLIGIAIGLAIGYFVFSTSAETPPDEIELTEDVAVEQQTQAEKTAKKASPAGRFNPGHGRFIQDSTLTSRVSAFNKWIKTNQITDKVLIPNSFFVGKDSLQALITRMDNEGGRQPKPGMKMAGLNMQLTLVQDTVTLTGSDGRPYEFIGSRLDPVLIPLRVNGKEYRVNPRKRRNPGALEMQGGDGLGTLLDDSAPCPHECP